MRNAVQALYLVPQGVGIEDEPRARHDVRPVAGFVLLQQKEALMLLCQQPLQSEGNVLRIAPTQPPRSAAPIENPQRDQPPQGRIDAPQVPEIGLLLLHIHELRNLSVRCLMSVS